MSGVYFVPSLIYLTLVVAGIYTLAQEPKAPRGHLLWQWQRRSLKLVGVLAGIMVVTFLLSRM
ncbi:MAG: hypothetical protein N2Z21_00745 [Candidatus Sumerlaeaceae bacterium]|nr:hypothetical protein [Candidatus Sumerlaeaceae bacterium]